MSFSINTNVASLSAQNYLRTNSNFQAQTINRVTSGLRIVQSGDDAAGLAIANGYRSDQAVLTQGVRNANDGLSQLQIIDGGLNNISQLLDRARTLATQSASGAFTGDRTVLNSEFQSVLGEIDRQSQSMGLNVGGTFAKALSVFIGGGKGPTAASVITNGSIALDLSKSTVDSQSLGLKGVQTQGNQNVDLSAAAATSVQNIIADATNKASESPSGYTSFVFTGPGFSDTNKIAVSVNLSNVNDPTTLVTAINAAIQGAGNGANSAATAFKNAGISASIVTDASGKQHLAFSAGSSTFQVGAGDLTANALLGNISASGSGVTGASMTTTVTASNAFTTGGSTTTSTVRFQGAGMTSPVDIAVTSGQTGTNAVTALQAAIASNNQLRAAGISLTTTTGTLQFSSTSGQKFTVQAAGDTANVLGLGAFNYGASSAVDYGTITGASPTVNSQTSSQATLEISLNGGASGQSSAALTTVSGAAVAVTNLVDTRTLSATGTLNLNVGGTNVAVDFSKDSNQGATESLGNIASYINSSVQAALGLGSGVNVVAADTVNHLLTFSPPAAGNSSFVSIAAGAAGTIANQLGFTTGPYYAGPGTATAASMLGAVDASGTNTVDTSSAGHLDLVIDGSALSISFGAGGDPNAGAGETGAQVASYISNTVRSALGLGPDVAVASFGTGGTHKFTLSSPTVGPNSSITIAATSTAAITTAMGLTPSATVTGTGSTGNNVTIGLSGGTAVAALATSSGTVGSVDTTVAGGMTGTIDGNAFTISWTLDPNKSATESLANAVAWINSSLKTQLGTTQNLASVVGGKVQISSMTTGANSSVVITDGGAGSDSRLLNLTSSAAPLNAWGTGPTVQDIAGRLTAAFTKNASLENAGMQATVTGSALTISSNNGSIFQLQENGGAGLSNLGFGIANTLSFAGNDSSIAPMKSPQLIAGGATQTTQLAFNGINNGGDAQLITVAANDSNGNQQSVNIMLRNDTTGRNAQNIDDAVAAINTALQQTNISALQSVVAVKTEANGVEGITFTSDNTPFNVAINKTPNGTGFSTSGTVVANVVGTGNTADVSNQLSAQNAVSALAASVTTLGKAQATVGKGENQFNYAINLAQSQLTNLATAESRIRDADLAAEAANLTKAQILMQAGVAALAQANAAPQQVLTLLH